MEDSLVKISKSKLRNDLFRAGWGEQEILLIIEALYSYVRDDLID